MKGEEKWKESGTEGRRRGEADLALRVFHFGLCSSSCPPVPQSLLLNLHFLPPPTFLPMLHLLHPSSTPSLLPVCLYTFYPHPPCLLSSLSLPTSLHLTYFAVSSYFQPIPASLGSTQRRVTGKVAFGILNLQRRSAPEPFSPVSVHCGCVNTQAGSLAS